MGRLRGHVSIIIVVIISDPLQKYQSLQSNFESLESICETSADQISSIAATCGATEAEIQTLFSGLSLLKQSLEGKALSTASTVAQCLIFESFGFYD